MTTWLAAANQGKGAKPGRPGGLQGEARSEAGKRSQTVRDSKVLKRARPPPPSSRERLKKIAVNYFFSIARRPGIAIK